MAEYLARHDQARAGVAHFLKVKRAKDKIALKVNDS
jgi:hypothetical protein